MKLCCRASLDFAYQILNAVPTYRLKVIASSICITLSVGWQKHSVLSKGQSRMYVQEHEKADFTILNNVWSSICRTGSSKYSNISVHVWPIKMNESKYKLNNNNNNNNNNNSLFYFFFLFQIYLFIYLFSRLYNVYNSFCAHLTIILHYYSN